MKKFYEENRIFVILMGIVGACLIIILILLLRYFYFGTGKDAVKECLNVNEGKTSDFVASLKKDEIVSDASIRVSDKTDIIYINIKFNDKSSLVEAQTKTIAALDILDEKTRECYDFQFMISKPKSDSDEGFNLMGSLNSNGTNVSWNNNNKVTEEE